jgi:ferredoxin
MKITIDAELCQGHGRCYELAPQIFTDDDRGRGLIVDDVVGRDRHEPAQAAMNACPERAISLG